MHCEWHTDFVACVLKHVTGIHKFPAGLCCGYFAPACRHPMLNNCALSSREEALSLLLTPTQLLRLTSAWVICQILQIRINALAQGCWDGDLGFIPAFSSFWVWIQNIGRVFSLFFSKVYRKRVLVEFVWYKLCSSTHQSINQPNVNHSMNKGLCLGTRIL